MAEYAPPSCVVRSFCRLRNHGEIHVRRALDQRLSMSRRIKSVLVLVALGIGAFALAFGAAKVAERFSAAKETPPHMVWIPGGEFTMGTDSDLGWADEKPAHRVRVNGFWMDETEVTNRQFRQVVEATGYITTAEKPPDVNEILRQSPPGTTAPRNEKLDPV